jgi:hypothetical protein
LAAGVRFEGRGVFPPEEGKPPCLVCGKRFRRKRRNDAKTCSPACRQMACRRRLGVTPRGSRVTANVHFSSRTDL